MIVVDTHAVLWLTQDTGQLSAPASAALIAARQSGGLAVADITLREIALLVSSGKVTISDPLGDYLEFVERLFQVVPISGAIALRSVKFSRRYPNDPADRLIGATAVVLGARLVTADRAIRASGEVNCVW